MNSYQKLPEDVWNLIQILLKAADPYQAVQNSLHVTQKEMTVGGKTYLFDQYERIILIGIGKAVIKMAKGVLDILGDRITMGVLIAKHMDSKEMQTIPERITLLTGNHPVPGSDSFTSTTLLMEQISHLSAHDLVICLISGGGSALCTLPEEGISMHDMQEMTQALLACGAEINEMNVLRKHVDAVKGGGLAAHVAPAQLVTLILSDVMGSPLDVIASGPTVPDESTFEMMSDIVKKYQLMEILPDSITKRLAEGLSGLVADTPKAGDPVFRTVQNHLVSSNYAACQAGLHAGCDAGYHTQLLTTYLAGEAREAGRFLAGLLRQINQSGEPLQRPACLLLGGETTVTLTGNGLGGRNQELALGAVRDLAGIPNVLLVTLATDGEDGPTNAAGAWVDGETYTRGLAMGMKPEDYLVGNDAYHYFEALHQLLMTGPTGTNVNDCVLLFSFS